MNQTAFDFRATDPRTSREAARDSLPRRGSHRWMALELFAKYPNGLTDFDLADFTGVGQTSIGKRRGELVRAGFVEFADKTRPAPSGSQSMVWKITDAGLAYLADNR